MIRYEPVSSLLLLGYEFLPFQSERSRRQAETENIDLRETTNALNEQNISLTGLRRKHDGEIAVSRLSQT